MRINKNQREIIKSIAKELKIPRNEVLFLFLELGLMMSVQTHDKELRKNIDKNYGHLPEYRNWKEITDLHHEYWKAGEEMPKP